MALKRTTYQDRVARDLRAKLERHRRMVKILNRLSTEFETWRRYTEDPFLLLVGTVLSQNTNWRNTRTAYNRLVMKFKTPQQLAEADVREVQRLIRPAGLYKIKSKRLKVIAQIVLDRYGGDLNSVLQMLPKKARCELLSIPGVGYKTADVVLVFAGGRDVLPIDTHIFRISKRLGFAPPNADYEEVRRSLEELIPRGRRGEAHILLIQHGRRYCRAPSPLCRECPINDLCPIGVRRIKLTRTS